MVTPSLNKINKTNGAQWTNQKLGHMHMMRTRTSDREGQSTQKKTRWEKKIEAQNERARRKKTKHDNAATITTTDNNNNCREAWEEAEKKLSRKKNKHTHTRSYDRIHIYAIK